MPFTTRSGVACAGQCDPARALAAARRNFEDPEGASRRARAGTRALAARDAAALQALRAWLRETGYRDSVTEGILGTAPRS